MTIFMVEEFTAGQWFFVRSFFTQREAEDFAARFPKARIITRVR